jgi:hypothetical protein
MIKIRLSQGIFIALLLASSAAGAEQYPAANFQPKVIYSSEAIATAAAPAANSPCLPKVEQSALDPKYPAASFQPKVIYSNTDAKQGS